MHRIELADTDTTAKAHTAIAAGLISTAGDQSCLLAVVHTEVLRLHRRLVAGTGTANKSYSRLSRLYFHTENLTDRFGCLSIYGRAGGRSRLTGYDGFRSYFLLNIHAPG